MPTKYLIFPFLLAISIGSIRNEPPTYQGFGLWPRKTQMLEMKEIKATFSKESMPPHYNGSMSSMEQEQRITSSNIAKQNNTEKANTEANRREDKKLIDEMNTSWEGTAHMDSNEKQMRTNRIKREIDSAEASMSFSIESIESIESAEENPKLLVAKLKPRKISKKTNKRQTSITGNGNRLSNLINLPVRLNVLANVLSKINQGVLDTKEKSLGSVTINGSDNTISSLVNAPIDVDAVVNLLSQVDTTKKAAATAGGSKGGLVDGLLGGLLGGQKTPAGNGNKGIVGGLLDGVLGDGSGSGLLGGLLGNTLGDLLGALLGGDGVVGNLLGGVNGKGLVTDLLHNLLGGVVGLVDNLLVLLVGILDGLLVGIASADLGAASQGSNIAGSHNHVSSLVNAPVRIEALINVLSSLRQELGQQLDPAAVKQGINIKGNNNQVSSLINLPVDLDLDLNLLSSVNKTVHQSPKIRALESSSGTSTPGSSLLGSLLGSGPHESSSSPGSSLVGSAPSEASAHESPSSVLPVSTASAGTNIRGNNNAISSLLNIVPDVDLNLNLLSEVTDLLVGKSDSSGVEDAGNPNEICFDIPISEGDTTIAGDNNKISNAINVKPKIHLDLNLLSTRKEVSASNGPTQRVCIKKPTQPLAPVAPIAMPPATALSSPSSEICFNVLVDQSGTVISGNGNQLTSLVNLDPTINVGLNLLSNIQQTNTAPNLVMKRICIPGSNTAAPVDTSANARCFKRTCTKWKQFLDYKCLSNPNEYPKFTITKEIEIK